MRRIERGYPDGDFQSDFARGLDKAYKARILAKRMFVNEHFLTLIYRPTAGAADKAAHPIFSMFDKASPAEAEDDSIEAFTDILRDAEKLMERANPRLLRTYEHKGSRSEEHTSELQSLRRQSIAVLC